VEIPTSPFRIAARFTLAMSCAAVRLMLRPKPHDIPLSIVPEVEPPGSSTEIDPVTPACHHSSFLSPGIPVAS